MKMEKIEAATTTLAPADAGNTLKAIERAFAVIEFDLSGTILRADETFLAVMGYDEPAELVGQHHAIFCGKAFAASAAYRQFWEQLGEGRFQQGEFVRVRKDGREVWLQASYNPIMDLSGEPCRIVKYAFDVTDQVMLERAVTERADKMSSLADHLAASIHDITE